MEEEGKTSGEEIKGVYRRVKEEKGRREKWNKMGRDRGKRRAPSEGRGARRKLRKEGSLRGEGRMEGEGEQKDLSHSTGLNERYSDAKEKGALRFLHTLHTLLYAACSA